MRRIITVLALLITVIAVRAQNANGMAQLKMTEEWDKVFPKSEKVEHEKVSFHNHFGFELAADVYKPKNAQGRLAAIAVCGPFGAVKEQSSGLYAQTLAERGFLAIAFDPSFTGESSGQPRDIFSLDINTEDFQAAVDYLSNRPDVDANRIGIVGICGWGCIALNAAANDPRIKATVASTMYDMPRVGAWGYFDKGTADDRYKAKEQIATLRTHDWTSAACWRLHPRRPADRQGAGLRTAVLGLLQDQARLSQAVGQLQWRMDAPDPDRMDEQQHLGCNAVLIVHGEKAHSRYMGEDTFKKLKGDNKQLIIAPGATHTDLYDQMDKIPFDRIAEFLNNYLK